MILPSAADTTLQSEISDLINSTGAVEGGAPSSSSPPLSVEEEDLSQPNSPTLLIHTPPAIPTTPPHLKKPKYRILTIHLEKEDDTMEWVVPIAGPHHKAEVMDITSCYLLGSWFEARMGDLVVSRLLFLCHCRGLFVNSYFITTKQKAQEYFISAAERGHTPSMIKAATLYEVKKTSPSPSNSKRKMTIKHFQICIDK